MIRKSLIALTAVAAIGAASLTPASAHQWHHWGWGGFGLGLGLVGASIAASGPYYVDDGCYRYSYVQTPSGHVRRILVNVCQ
jgi:hypothetical protein